MKDISGKKRRQAGRGGGIEVFEGIVLRMGRLVALGEKGKTKGVISKLSSMGIKRSSLLDPGKHNYVFMCSGICLGSGWCEIKCNRVIFCLGCIWRFEADRITERQAYISGRNSPLPRVYGKMQTEVSDNLAGAITYMKRYQIVKGQVNLDEALMKKLVQV